MIDLINSTKGGGRETQEKASKKLNKYKKCHIFPRFFRSKALVRELGADLGGFQGSMEPPEPLEHSGTLYTLYRGFHHFRRECGFWNPLLWPFL